MKILIKDKHKFGVIENDLHFEAAICDKGPKQRLIGPSHNFPYFEKIDKD